MSSIARKNKRRAAFKCAKRGIAPAQAMALVVQLDYGKLNAKDKRLAVLAELLYKRSIQVKTRKMDEAENETCQRFAGAVMEIWEAKEKKSNGKA